MSDRPLKTDIERTVADIENVRRLIRRTGLSGLDETTPEGRMVLQLEAALMEASNKQIPEVVRQEAVHIAIESMLFRRSLATLILKARAPSPGSSKQAEHTRAAFRIGVTAYRTFVSSYEDALHLLGVEGFGPKLAGTKEKTFDEILADRALRRAAIAQATDANNTITEVQSATSPDLPARADQPPVPVPAPVDREAGEGGEPEALPSDSVGAETAGALDVDEESRDDALR